MADPKTILEFVKKNGVKMLDLRFTDLPGLQHHVSFPIEQLSEASFDEGFGMDGSSIRGWAAIHESDMLLIPDPNTFMLDPFTEVPTLVMVCDVVDPVTKQRYDRDPRYIAKKAEMYLGSTGGQTEIDLKFDWLVRSADHMMLYKYVVKNVANQYGKTVTFMPKPIFQDNGSGMHTHQSLWKSGKPLFAGDGYAGLSQTALWYIGGLIKHGPALSAIIAPTTNSYKRLVPGFEAPVNLAYSRRNRSAACRIPMYSASPKAKRVEFRPPDPSCNPYMGFAAMMMAGLD